MEQESDMKQYITKTKSNYHFFKLQRETPMSSNRGGDVSFQPSRSLQHLSGLFGPLILHS